MKHRTSSSSVPVQGRCGTLMLAAALGASLAVPAVAEEALDGTGKVIGLVAMSLNSEFTQTLLAGAQKEANATGATLEIQGGSKFASAAEQLDQVENYLSEGVDGLIIIPSSSEGLVTALQQVKEQGVPIVNLDTRLSADVLEEVDLTVPFYGTNNYNGAKAAGEYAAQNFEAGTKLAILKGIDGQEPAIDRYNGFLDGAGDAVELVAEQTANWEVDEGYTATQNILSANPDLQLIFASNDGMGIGALRAVQEAGLTDQIKIISYDGTGEAVDLVESGDLFATVAQYPAEMGKEGIDNLLRLIAGEEAVDEIDTGSKLITQEEVPEFKEYLSQFEE